VRDPRAAARAAVADKPDSQEICFVPDGDYAAFVEREAPELARPGAIVDEDGRVLGTHGGVHRFTVGQRKGLRLSSAMPLYVWASTRPRARDGRPEGAARSAPLTASASTGHRAAPPATGGVAGADPSPAPSGIRARPRRRRWAAEVEFDEPQTAVTPGQAVVFYDGDEVVGGGWIESSIERLVIAEWIGD
jgi:tRNA-uridine 2-sulfurtransferase